MGQNLELAFMDSKDLYKRFNIMRWAELFQNNGFETENLKVAEKVFSPKSSPQGIMEYIGQAKEVSFVSFNPTWNLEFFTAIGWGEKIFGAENRFWLSIRTDNTPYFWRKEYQPDNYANFIIDFGKQIYGLLFPEYGWIDFDGGGYPPFTEIEQGKLSKIYWANFLGAKFVQMIGKAKLFAAPVRRIEILSNEGILFRLSSCPGLTTDHVEIEEVKKYFDGITVR